MANPNKANTTLPEGLASSFRGESGKTRWAVPVARVRETVVPSVVMRVRPSGVTAIASLPGETVPLAIPLPRATGIVPRVVVPTNSRLPRGSASIDPLRLVAAMPNVLRARPLELLWTSTSNSMTRPLARSST